MDLKTIYLGMELRSPLVPSASPLSEDVSLIKRMEDAGAGAVVLHSLFEEQLRVDRLELHHHLSAHTESFAEALTYFPQSSEYKLCPEEYLEHVHKAKRAVRIPIIASLNGTTPGGWTGYAKVLESAGADAIELNIYSIPTDPELSGSDVESDYEQIVKAVTSAVKIPVVVKLSPFFSNLAHTAKRLEDAGARGLVLFNRFYQPDINLGTLQVEPRVLLSTPMAARLPLRWIAILSSQRKLHLAASSGSHTGEDVVKMLLAGARVTQVCSVLLKRGIEHLRVIERQLQEWLEQNGYISIRQLQGSMNQSHCLDPQGFERAQYMRAITSAPYSY